MRKKQVDLRFAKSMIRPSGGFDVIPDAVKSLIITGKRSHPSLEGLRFSVSARLLGRLERLARSRFDIGRLSRNDLEDWRSASKASLWEIAQSVNASSKIEGEEVKVDELSLIFAAVTQPAPDAPVQQELSGRAGAVRAIYEAYLWALTLDRKSFLDMELVLEVHRRMFESTKPDSAGRLKRQPVSIEGAGYSVLTLPPSQVRDFLEALCTRTDDRLARAVEHAEESSLLVVGEFLCDFLAIHPFEDGNGRTARLISTYLLERCGFHFARFYPLDNVILETRVAYYEALFRSQMDWYSKSEDLTPWIEYYVSAVFAQFHRAFQRALEQYGKETSVL